MLPSYLRFARGLSASSCFLALAGLTLAGVPAEAWAQAAPEPAEATAATPASAEMAADEVSEDALGDALVEAARRGDVSAIASALGQGVPVDAAGSDGATALHHAVAAIRVEAVRALLEARADVQATALDGTTPLHWASRGSGGATGRPVAELLLAAKADPTVEDLDGKTPLHAAAFEGDAPLTDLLIEHGAEIDATDGEGNTPIQLAVAGGIQLDRFARGYGGGNQASSGHQAALELLLAHGAAVDARGEDGFTALHRAARNGHRPFTEILLAGGADPTIRSVTGATPRDLAVMERQDEVVALLGEE